MTIQELVDYVRAWRSIPSNGVPATGVLTEAQLVQLANDVQSRVSTFAVVPAGNASASPIFYAGKPGALKSWMLIH